jgi:hypothetical protein
MADSILLLVVIECGGITDALDDICVLTKGVFVELVSSVCSVKKFVEVTGIICELLLKK